MSHLNKPVPDYGAMGAMLHKRNKG